MACQSNYLCNEAPRGLLLSQSQCSSVCPQGNSLSMLQQYNSLLNTPYHACNTCILQQSGVWYGVLSSNVTVPTFVASSHKIGHLSIAIQCLCEAIRFNNPWIMVNPTPGLPLQLEFSAVLCIYCGLWLI